MYQVVKSTTFLRVDEDLWEWELFPATGWDGEMAQLIWRTIWQYPMKLKTCTTEPFHSRVHRKQTFSVFWGKWVPCVAEIGTHSALVAAKAWGAEAVAAAVQGLQKYYFQIWQSSEKVMKDCPSKTPQACQIRSPSLTCLSCTFVQHMHLSTHSIVGGKRGNYLNVHQQKKQ